MVACETQKKLGSSRRIQDREFYWGGVGRMSIPESHVAPSVQQVYNHVQFGYRGTAETVATEMQVEVGRKWEKGWESYVK
jgi:hypothetical protein